MTQSKKPLGNTASASENIDALASDVKSSTEQVVKDAKDRFSEVATQAQETAKSQLDQRKDQVADGMDHLVQALRHTSKQLPKEDSGPVGEYMSRAAERLDQISHHLRENDVSQLLNDVEGFARREPALMLGGAFAIGVIAARFLKSSNQRRYSGYASKASQNYNRSGNDYGNSYMNQYANRYSDTGSSEKTSHTSETFRNEA